jgi:hypothetical protein
MRAWLARQITYLVYIGTLFALLTALVLEFLLR